MVLDASAKTRGIGIDVATAVAKADLQNVRLFILKHPTNIF